MRCSASTRLVPLAFALFAATLVHGSIPRGDGQFAGALLARDDHHHADTPLLVLNETEISMWYGTTPDSFYTIDWEGAGQPGARYPALIMTHIVLMSLAFFVLLPISKLPPLLSPHILIGVYCAIRHCNAFCETCGSWHCGRSILCTCRPWLYYEFSIFKAGAKYVSVYPSTQSIVA